MKFLLKKPTWHKLARRTRERAENVTEAAKAGAKAVEQRAEDTLAQASLRRMVRELEGEIALQMASLGELVYATHRGTPSDSEEMEKLLSYIDVLENQLAEHRQELARPAKNALLCPVCGTENPDTNVYCHNCGQPLRKS
jgi:rubrerythrin